MIPRAFATAVVIPALLSAAERHYDFYQPQVKHVTIYKGKLAPGHYGYNHMASVEWFDGRFHVVWGGHAASQKEGVPGQVNLWATSADFPQWKAPAMAAEHRCLHSEAEPMKDGGSRN